MSEEAHTVTAACDSALVSAFDLLGKKWNGIILAVLRPGPMKFSDLRRAVGGITDSVLTDRLVDLVDAGLVDREETHTRPNQITYALSAQGSAIQPVLDELAQWASKNLPRPTEKAGVPAGR